MKTKFDVTGMTCSACSAHVEKAVNKVDGVKKVAVNLIANSMVVQYDENKTNSEAIIKAVVNAGYGAAVNGANNSAEKPSKVSKAVAGAVTLPRLITSVVICVVLMYVGMGHMVKLPLPSFLEERKTPFRSHSYSFCCVCPYGTSTAVILSTVLRDCSRGRPIWTVLLR